MRAPASQSVDLGSIHSFSYISDFKMIFDLLNRDYGSEMGLINGLST